MKKIFLLLVCLLSLNTQSSFAGHTARAATGSGTGGTGIETINNIGPTNTHNFTIESADDSVTITALPHGIDLSVPASVETINGLSPDSSGNFTVTAGAGAIITAGLNSFTISAPGGGSGVSTIVADSAGFATGNVVISGGSTGLTTDATSSTEIDLTGVLNLSHGGTNANLTASNGGIFYSNSTAGAILSGTATANQVLLSGSSSAPSWSTATYPGATTANELLYSSSTNTVGQITTANDGVLITSNTGVPSWLANGTTGQVLKATAGSPPSWGTITTDEGVSEFVVDSQGGAGYTTIQAAITAAAAVATSTTPQTVWIWPGTYTEDIALADNVNLVSTAASTCIIIGNTTYSAGASNPSVTLKSITFQTPSGGGDALEISGSNGCTFVINNCIFNGTFGDCFSVLTIGTNFAIYESTFNASSTFKTFNLIHGLGYFFSCLSQATDTPAVIQNVLVFFYDHFGNDSFLITSTAFCFFKSCFIESVGSGSLFQIQSGSTLDVDNTTVTCNSGTGFWASGVSGSYGTINYNGMSPSRGTATKIDPLLTLGNYQMQVGNISFDGGVSFLNTKTQGTNHQVLLGTGTSAVSTVSGTGTSGQVLTSNGTGADPTWQAAAGGSTEGVSEFVVDSQGGAGYTTIQAAITAAALVATSTTPQTVWVWPGTYTEDLILAPFVNLASGASGVIVNGSASYATVATSEYFYCNGIEFAPTTGAAFTVSGTGAPTLTFDRCVFKPVAGACFVSSNSSGTHLNTIYQNNCVSTALAGYKIYNFTNSSLYLTDSNNLCTDTGSTFSGSLLAISSCIYVDNISLSSSSVGIVTGCYATSVASGALFTLDGTSSLYALNSTVSTAGTYWATGTGTINYGAIINLDGSSRVNTTLTRNPETLQVGDVSFDGGVSALNPTTLTANQVVLGTATSALSNVAAGTSGQVLTSNGAAAPTWQDFTQTEGVSEFVVDSQGNAGYTTVQAAITAAALVATSTTPQTVWIWPGTYTENVTIGSSYVNLASASVTGVRIVGNTILSTSNSGTFTANNITFSTPSGGGSAFTFSGTHDCVPTFENCIFNGTTGDCFTVSNTAGDNIFINSCVFNASSGHKTFNTGSSTASNYYVFSCVQNSTDTAAIFGGSCLILMNGMSGNDSFSLQNDSYMFMKNSFLQSVGSNPSFAIGASAKLDISFTSVTCQTGTYWATGTGGLFYTNINPSRGSATLIDPGLTSTGYEFQGGSISFDGGVTSLDPTTLTSGEVVLGTATSALSTLSTIDNGVLITSNTGVTTWLPNGTTNQVLMATTGAAPSWQANPAIGTTEGVSLFVVDSQGNAGYTTIQSAIDAAALVATSATPQTVWIWPGTYNETLTLHDYVNLAEANGTGVFVVGNVTYTPVATNAFLSMKGIVITTPSGGGAAFTLAGSVLCHVFFNNCTFNGTTGNSFVSTNTNGNAEIFMQNCLLNASSSRKIFDVSGGSGIFIRCFGCYVVSANTASTITNDTYLYYLGSYVNDSYVVSSSNVVLWVEGCQCKGAGSLPFVNCSVQFANAVIFDSSVTCHNTYWATGPGTLFYGNVTSFGTALDGTGSTGSAIDPTMGSATGFPSQVDSISFDGNVTALNTVTQGTVNQVLLGTGTSAISTVSGTGTTGQLLTSNGTGADPTWQDNPGVLTINTLSPDGSGNFSVVAGSNISITSGTNSITINSSGLGGTTEGVSQFVVDSGGTQGYTTIQAAITAAAAVATSTTQQTVWIWPGTYTEDLTMASYVNLSAATADSVFVTGNATYSPSASGETVFVHNLVFNTPATGDAFSMGGIGASNIYFSQCIFNATNGSGAGISGTNPNGVIYQYLCSMNASSGNQNYNAIVGITAYSTNTSGGAGSSFLNGGGQGFSFSYCTFFETLNVYYQFIMNDCIMISHNVVMNGGTLYARNCLFDTGTPYWVTGTGNVFYGAILTGVPIDPALTANATSFQSGQISFDGGISSLNTATQGTNHQVLLGTGTSAVSTVSGTGTSGQVLTSNGTGASPTWTTISANSEGVSKFVVDSQGGAGYTTIQSAITAAALVATSTTPQTVWIWPGTYNESIALSPFVNLASAAAGVVITGNVTYTSVTTGEECFITQIEFKPTTGDAFTQSGTGTPKIVFNNCIFTPVAGQCVVSTSSAPSNAPTISQNNCASIAPSGYRIYNLTNTSMNIIGCNNFAGTVASIYNGGGVSQLFINATVYGDSFIVTNGFLLVNSCFITQVGGVPAFTLDSSSGMFITTTSITGAGTTYWATGTGNLYYSGISIVNATLQVNPTLTTHPAEVQVGTLSFDGGVSSLNTATQGTNHQVVLGTGTSAVSVVSGTGTTGQTLTSNGTGVNPTWQNSGSVLAVTSVSYTQSPYTALTTDYYLKCSVPTTPFNPLTINLPAAPTTGQAFVIKDASGHAFTNHITIAPLGGVLIDGSASYVLNKNYQSASVLFDGAAYEIFSSYAGQ